MQKLKIKRNSNYTTIANFHLKDEKLSWKAKGLLTYLLHLPDNWEVWMNELQKRSKDGKDSLLSAVRELEKMKYIKRLAKDEKNLRKGYDFLVSESPLFESDSYAENPPSLCGKSAKPYAENPPSSYAENPPILNTNRINTKSNTNSPDFSTHNLEDFIQKNPCLSYLKNHGIKYNILVSLSREGYVISDEDYLKYLQDFANTLRLRNDFDKNKHDARKHFGNWLLRQLSNKQIDNSKDVLNSKAYQPFKKQVYE